MHLLNLPAYACKLKHSPEQSLIFDLIRRKYVVLTPEEWVRQHFINYLVHHLQYPKALIAVERGTSYHQLAKRTDLCVYGPDRLPLLLVECKATEVAITAQVVKQASAYNKTLQARYVVLTNGRDHYCWQVDHHQQSYAQLDRIPAYPELLSQLLGA